MKIIPRILTTQTRGKHVRSFQNSLRSNVVDELERKISQVVLLGGIKRWMSRIHLRELV
jgi:hypothetical protein